MAGACRQFGTAANHVAIDNDGQLTLVGNSRVYNRQWLEAQGLRLPGTKPATIVAFGFSSALEFSDATDDTVEGKMKAALCVDASENPDFYVAWSCPTADPGNDTKQCVWQLEYTLHQADSDMSSASPGVTRSIIVTASTSTNGLVESPIEVTGLVAGVLMIEFRLKRLGADGDDDLGDLAHLHGVYIKYTQNRIGTAI